jgi:hypothetical protein
MMISAFRGVHTQNFSPRLFSSHVGEMSWRKTLQSPHTLIDLRTITNELITTLFSTMNPGTKHRALLGRRLLAVFLGFSPWASWQSGGEGLSRDYLAQLKEASPSKSLDSVRGLMLTCCCCCYYVPTVPTNLATSKSLRLWAT